MLGKCHSHLSLMEVDWLRVKPVVKVIGEFWAQQTEGDGNYQIFDFLEKEGAEVSVEPISNWVLYLLRQAKARSIFRSLLLPHNVPWKTARSRAFRGEDGTLGQALHVLFWR